MSKEIQKLPTLQELHHDTEAAFKNDQLNALLNQNPIPTWIKTNPFAGNNKYIPIDKIEFMLTRIFQHWRVEVIEYKQLFNAVSCHVRLHYLNPVTGEWQYHDGVGASQIQTKKDASAAELDKINNNAVQMALPASKSYAIKDAADHLGSLFGRDLNRKDVVPFSPAYSKEEVSEDLKSKYNGTETEDK